MWIEKIENLLIIISRYFLIAIGSLALIGALLALVYSLTLIVDSPSTSKGRLPQISYDESYKTKLFPKPKQPVTSFQAPRNITSTPPNNNQNPVDKRFVEAAKAVGIKKRVILFKIEIPLALPSIMTGVNQTIMMALAMVVIASMIGVSGLGVPILRSISNQFLALGLMNGLAIVALAIIFDRISQNYARRIQKHKNAKR